MKIPLLLSLASLLSLSLSAALPAPLPTDITTKPAISKRAFERVKVFNHMGVPVQGETMPFCMRWVEVLPGDTCESVAALGLVTAQYVKWANFFLNKDCTNMWAGYDICVGARKAKGFSYGLGHIPDLPGHPTNGDSYWPGSPPKYNP